MTPINIAGPTQKANPFPFYARLRAEQPVFAVRLPDKQTAFLVARYDDVVGVLKDERLAKDKLNALTPAQLKKLPWLPPMFKPLASNMLDQDPPNHTRLRALVQHAFTPRRVELTLPRIESLVDELLSSALARQQIDLIADFAQPLPTTIISEMIGVPANDRQRFVRWSNALVSSSASSWGIVRAIPAVISLMRYVRRLIRMRRLEPRDDLLSALIAAEEAGTQLSDDELLAMIVLLLIAGHETTVNLIGNGMLALLQHPDEYARLRAEPQLVAPAVEELLRFAPPLETATERYAREDMEIAGVKIPRGSLVFAALASANRDEKHFAEADRLDLSRQPNKHLTFGLGIHYCLGAPLARLEGQIAIGSLARCSKSLQLAVPSSALAWRPGLVLRGLKSLPLRVGKLRTAA
jgi:cytochrome P450 PksS